LIWPFNKKTETRSIVASPSGGFFDLEWTLGRKRDSLSLPTAYACIRLLANSVSQTEIRDLSKTANGKEHLSNSRLTKLLRNPAPNVTQFQFFSTMMTSLTGRGNAYAYIVRDDNQSPIELIFIPSESVGVFNTDSIDEPYYYRITLNDNSMLKVWPEDMIHLKNITIDGFNGINPIQEHSLTLDSSGKISEYINSFMGNASQISGVIEGEQKVKQETVTQIRENFGKIYGGASNSGKTAVLGDGFKYKQLKPISPLDADYIKSKQINDNDIMRIYGVPPPMIGQMDATYNNTEQLALIFQRQTLQPIFVSIQQELSLKLIPSRYQGVRMLEFTPNPLKMATARDKAETMALLKREGAITPNEVREEYGLIKIDGLDEITLPLNIAPLGLHKEVLIPVEPEPMETEVIEEDPQMQPEQSEDETRELHKVKSELGRVKKLLANSKPTNVRPDNSPNEE
jgi:HK97 family phage portal protein